jgi:hypothetical protein
MDHIEALLCRLWSRTPIVEAHAGPGKPQTAIAREMAGSFRRSHARGRSPQQPEGVATFGAGSWRQNYPSLSQRQANRVKESYCDEAGEELVIPPGDFSANPH